MEERQMTSLQLGCLYSREVLILIKSTPSETNSLHLKMDGWKSNFLLGRPIFHGAMLVSGYFISVNDNYATSICQPFIWKSTTTKGN